MNDIVRALRAVTLTRECDESKLRAEIEHLKAALTYSDGAIRHIEAIDKLSPEAAAIATDAHNEVRRVLEEE